MQKILIFFFVVVTIGFGCEKASFKDAALLNTKWELSSIQDTKTNLTTNVPNTIQQEFIFFSDTSNILMVAGACNGCRGSYLMLSNDSIKITNLTCTCRDCTNDLWEKYFFENLNSVFKFKITGNHMKIYSTETYNLNFTAE